ncbi:hypothetical protein MKS88_002095 [Plasmodium brasilianum]|uniref:Uncharacterized protein n=1 Tax=Plasmodium brasilianum TaxID=5824 RepID=A0ACB9YDM0_PLABR|nr:hypothetical protein MKS88_002095 [Plasmodium brasilianum]
MLTSHDLNTYDISSSSYNGIYIGNIFSEIQDEINNTCIIESAQRSNCLEYNNEKVNGNNNNSGNSSSKNNSHNNSNNCSNCCSNSFGNSNNINADINVGKILIGSNYIGSTHFGSNNISSTHFGSNNVGSKHFGSNNIRSRGKISIEEYVNFINDKKNEYKKKKKEYVIEYINQRKIKKMHYEDMELLFKKFTHFLDLQEKCLLCNNYLSLSYLYLNRYLKKEKVGNKDQKENYNNKGFINKWVKKNSSLIFCECLENIDYSKQYISDKKDDCYIDMIHLFRKNTSFSFNTKKSVILKEFMKNVKFKEFFKYNSFNENYYNNTFPIKNNYNIDTKYINVCRYIEKPTLTIEHVKALNSHTENFIPIFKIHNVNTLVTTVEKKLLIECLKVVKKIFFYDKIDKLTYIFQKNTYAARRVKMVALKIYKNGDDQDDEKEHVDF